MGSEINFSKVKKAKNAAGIKVISLWRRRVWLMLIIWRERERERERFDAFLVAFGGIFSIFSYNQLASLLIELRKVWSRPTCQDPLSNRVSSQGCFCTRTSAGGDMQASLRKRKGKNSCL